MNCKARRCKEESLLFLTKGSVVSVFQTVYEAGGHLGDLLEFGIECLMSGCFQQSLSSGQFKKRHALLDTSAGDAEEVLPIRFCEATISFGDVRGNRQGRTVEWIRQEEVSAWESLCQTADGIGEVNGLLLDMQFFKGKGHRVIL